MQHSNYRITSIDILRGMVMIIMALDHTRDFFHSTAMTTDPLNGDTTTPALYFTRWITHFCAPVFVMLSGMSAYLSSRKKTSAEASTFLFKRGLWLIVVEITIVTFGLTFNPVFSIVILQVIWAIGCSMILLALLSRISYQAVLIAGITMVMGHNALDYANLPQTGTAAYVWKIFFTARGTVIPVGDANALGVFYAILPWTGIMFIGYAMGAWFTPNVDQAKRKRALLFTGTSMIIIFIISRLLKGYGDPGSWNNGAHSLMSFLNTSKYPPSLQYTCMTLGPALLVMAFTENIRATWTNIMSVYGRVPFFYYVLHFYLLHSLLAVLFFASGYSTNQIVDPQLPFLFRPTNFGYGLPIVYIIWLGVVVLLYFPCRWFYAYKTSHHQWWLRYL